MEEVQNIQPVQSASLPRLISVGNLYSQAWEIYRARFGIFFGIAAVPMVAGILGITITLFSHRFASQTLLFPIIGFLISILSAILSFISLLAIIYAIAKPVSIGEAYNFSISKLFSFVWISILSSAVIV